MSSFFDDIKQLGTSLFRRGKSGVGEIAVAVDQRTQLSRLSGSIRKLNSERGEVLEQIGRKVYALHNQGRVKNKDVASDCARIDEITAQIAVIREEIEAIRRGNEEELEVPELEDDGPLETDGSEAAPADVDLDELEPEEKPEASAPDPQPESDQSTGDDDTNQD